MSNENQSSIFSADTVTDKEPIIIERAPIENATKIISAEVNDKAKRLGEAFADEIAEGFISDFEKSEALYLSGKVDEKDLMVHVSTFLVMDGTIYMSYYASTKNPSENPDFQTARLVWCPANDTDNKTYIYIQGA